MLFKSLLSNFRLGRENLKCYYDYVSVLILFKNFLIYFVNFFSSSFIRRNMDEKMEKYAETIALLRKEIKAKDKDLHLAATFGKQLLEEREKINLKLQESQSRVEALEQEKYSLQLDLERQIQTARTQTSELEIQTDLVDSLKKKMSSLEKETTAQRQRSDNLLKEKADLENAQEDLLLENSSLKKKIMLLEQQIETFEDNIRLTLDETKSEEDHPDITSYITKNKNLENDLAELQHKLQSIELKENRLINLVKELEEAVAERDKELSSYSVEIQRAKDYSAELQCEIEVLKLDQLDPKRRGNSMFGELDDRRRLVEKEYKILSNKYDNVLKNYEENKNELNRCKGHMAILLSMTSKKYQDTYIEKLENMLSSARRDNETLTIKLGKAMKNQPQQSFEPTTGDKYDYLRLLLQQSQKKINDLENELMTTRMQVINTENSLSVINNDLYKSKRDFSDLKIENLKLKQEIKELTFKPDSAPIKSEPNVEILPGFESNPETLKIAEMARKGIVETKENDIIPGELMLGENGFVEIKAPRLSNKAKLRNAFQRNETNKKPVTLTSKSTLQEINEERRKEIPLLPVVDTETECSALQSKKNGNCAQQ